MAVSLEGSRGLYRLAHSGLWAAPQPDPAQVIIAAKLWSLRALPTPLKLAAVVTKKQVAVPLDAKLEAFEWQDQQL